MKKLFTLGAAVAMVAVLAACGGGSGGSTTAASNTGGGTVSVAHVGGAGSVLVDSSGQALYASDQENASGMVMCTGACNSFWEPLTVSSAPMGGAVASKLGAAKRPDGSKQVTYDGKFLYTFTQEGPGEVTGDGFEDAFDGQQFVWHVIDVGGAGGATANSSENSTESGNGPVGY